MGSPPTNHSSSQKTRINVLSYGIKIWTDLSSVLPGITRVTDRRTDRRTEFSSLYRVCITCSAVKSKIRSFNTSSCCSSVPAHAVRPWMVHFSYTRAVLRLELKVRRLGRGLGVGLDLMDSTICHWMMFDASASFFLRMFILLLLINWTTRRWTECFSLSFCEAQLPSRISILENRSDDRLILIGFWSSCTFQKNFWCDGCDVVIPFKGRVDYYTQEFVWHSSCCILLHF